jgi:glycosyltransferase involved in cell wall biosynthesis
MASGTPVVAVGEMGTVFVMQGDNGGFMVPNDPDSFASRVIQLLQDAELRQRKAAEALAYAERWSITAMAERLVGVYERVLARRKA